MKIIQLISSSGFYGAEKVVLELCAHLYSGGHEVQLGVFVNQGQGEVALAAEASKLGVPVVPFPCRGRFDARTMGLIRQHVLTHRVDLAHSHGYKADIYTGLASLPQETIRVSTCHNWLTDSLKLMAFELLNKLVLHRFHQVVAVSSRLDRELEGAGIPPARRTLIHNGLAVYAPRVDRAAVRSSLGLDPDAPLLVAIGRLDPWKAHHRLLEAMALLGGEPAPRLLLVGDGDLRADLQQQAHAAGLGQRVIFAGYRRDIPELLAASDLFVISSIKEGLPMVLLEAMGAGVPVISTSVGAIPDALEQGACGALVPPGDAGALAAAVVVLLAHPGRRQEMAARAQQKYSELYSREAMGQRYETLYGHLLETA